MRDVLRLRRGHGSETLSLSVAAVLQGDGFSLVLAIFKN